MHSENKVEIRPIVQNDNETMYKVIRTVFEEMSVIKQGTAYFDECLPVLYETYTGNKSGYFTALLDNQIVGGAGIYPTTGLPEGTVELVKMYLLSEARGKGIGQSLMNQCVQLARKLGYTRIYLETLSEFEVAQHMYVKNGFITLDNPMGESGHYACSVRMIKQLV
jgi:putative acetyltransferase